jgi:hypothetical protein
VGSF